MKGLIYYRFSILAIFSIFFLGMYKNTSTINVILTIGDYNDNIVVETWQLEKNIIIILKEV